MTSANRAIWFGNFDFEHQLRHATSTVRSDKLKRINEELSSTLVLAAQTDDYVVVPQNIELGFFETLRSSGLPRVTPISEDQSTPADLLLRPWGWTASARTWGTQSGCRVVAPDQNAVIAANSREFSFELEQEWDIGPQGSAEIHSLSELSALIDMAPANGRGWLFKAEFGMSGRESFRVSRSGVNELAHRWVDKRLQIDGRVFVEPVLNCVEEVGMQFDIPPTGEISFLGIARLVADDRGTYRASRPLTDQGQFEKWNRAIEFGSRAAHCAQSRGYFGPFGVDAMRHRTDDGQEFLRPLQDINARMTMGRLASRLPEFCEPGEHCTWVHVRWSSDTLSAIDWYTRLQQSLPQSMRTVRTSPFEIDSQPTSHGSIAIFGKSPEELDRVETSIFADENPVRECR